MRRKHRRTLAAILETPTRSGIRWEDIESLLLALGAELEERAGSRIGVRLELHFAVFHRPHPRPEASKDLVEAVRHLLSEVGITNVDV